MRVVIAPRTESTEEVLGCLRSWSAAGLLDGFCLWRVALDSNPNDARGVILLDPDGERVGTLPEVLRDTPSEEVTMLAFYASGENGSFDPRFGARVRECMRLVTNVLAYDQMRPLECTTIVVPEHTAQPVPPELFAGSWNAYVAPEDRSAPRSANQLPDSSGFQSRHAAHALATVADLWVDRALRPTGVLEALSGEDVFAIEPPAVRVLRCFSRVIDFGYIADHVAAGVFQAGEEWPNPDPEHFDRVSDPSRLVKHTVRELLELHAEALGLTSFDPVTLPPERRPTLLEAVRELIGMLLARARRLPFELEKATIGAGYELLARRIDKLRGPDAPRTLRWREKPGQERDIASVTEEIDRPISMPDGPVGNVWRDIRQAVLSLVDGSDPPTGIEARSDGRGSKRELVTKPAALAPDPAQPPPRRGGERACDPLSLDPGLANDPSENEEASEENEEMVAWLESRRPSLLWGVGYRIATNLKAARAAAEELEAATAASADDGAAEDGEAEDGEAKDSEESEEAPHRSRWRRLRNSLVLNTFIAALASGLAWTQLAFLPGLIGQAVVVAGWLFGFASLALRFVRTERAIVRAEVEQQLALANRAIERALHAGDVPRLERRYAEYLDWAEIIGSIVHQPWVGEPIERVKLREAIAQSTLPAALQVGVAEMPPEMLERLASQARAKIFQPRWLSEHYGSVQRDAMARVELSYSYAGTKSAPDPDADNLDDPDSPRRQLLAAIQRGDGRHLSDNEMTEEVLGFVDRLPLDAAAESVSSPFIVQSGGADSERGIPQALPPCAAWFAPPPSLSELAPRLLSGVIRISANSATGPRVGLGALLSPEGLAVTSLSVLGDATSVQLRLHDGSQHDASIARTLPEADMALLQIDGDTGFDHPLALADSEARLGDPIVAPTPPGTESGAPEMALGLVTAKPSLKPGNGDFRLLGATYRSVAGQAGSPVFDLHGRVVGVHCTATFGDGDELFGPVRPVVESTAIAALLAGHGDGDEPAGTAGEQEPDEAQATPTHPGNGSQPVDAPNASPVIVVARPSQFIGELFPLARGPVGLPPQHWVDPDDQHLTEVVGEVPELDEVDLAGLSAGARFMQPLRTIVHRVDVTQPMAARELASCANWDQGDAHRN